VQIRNPKFEARNKKEKLEKDKKEARKRGFL